MHASAARIFTTRIRKKILCNIKLASGHLPIRVVRNFTSVMTVMRILEKAFEKFFPYPLIPLSYDKPTRIQKGNIFESTVSMYLSHRRKLCGIFDRHFTSSRPFP